LASRIVNRAKISPGYLDGDSARAIAGNSLINGENGSSSTVAVAYRVCPRVTWPSSAFLVSSKCPESV